MRLQVATREGVTQLDPQKSGIRQKGVLAFRLLQTPWNLALDIEQVDPWIQVTSLQHATINEAQIKVAANLQYQIENTGLKELRVFLPTNCESVRFQGDQVLCLLHHRAGLGAEIPGPLDPVGLVAHHQGRHLDADGGGSVGGIAHSLGDRFGMNVRGGREGPLVGEQTARVLGAHLQLGDPRGVGGLGDLAAAAQRQVDQGIAVQIFADRGEVAQYEGQGGVVRHAHRFPQGGRRAVDTGGRLNQP